MKDVDKEAFRKWEAAEAAVGRAYGVLSRAMVLGDRREINRASAAHEHTMMGADRARKAAGIIQLRPPGCNPVAVAV